MNIQKSNDQVLITLENEKDVEFILDILRAVEVTYLSEKDYELLQKMLDTLDNI